MLSHFLAKNGQNLKKLSKTAPFCKNCGNLCQNWSKWKFLENIWIFWKYFQTLLFKFVKNASLWRGVSAKKFCASLILSELNGKIRASGIFAIGGSPVHGFQSSWRNLRNWCSKVTIISFVRSGFQQSIF